tara:strand:+ start:13 stop:435 length:423 start_codon:yes stop_codon:yes gene_type:complete
LIDKESLEIKLKKLLDLCSKNEPTDKEMKKHFLFDVHQIQAYGMYRTIQDKFEFLTSEDLIDIMRSANILWKIQNGKLPNNTLKDWMDVMNEEIEVDMNGGNTVGAIKEYRNTMRKFTGIEPTLRESKEYVEKYMESLGE